jgi:hypothetical protein
MSPAGDRHSDRVGKYLEAAVRLVWVIDPRNARAIVYRSL